MPRRNTGFTLIELLVVVAVIAILVALLLPAVQAVREAARKGQCQDHLHNWAIALHNYEGSRGSFPYGAMGMEVVGSATTDPNPNNFGWHVMTLPYIEQKTLYDQFDMTKNLGHTATNKPLWKASFGLLFCPSGTRLFQQTSTVEWTTHYYGVAGPKGPKPPPATENYAHEGNVSSNFGGFCLSGILVRNRTYKMRHVVDGTSNTFLIGERSWDPDMKGYEMGYRSWLMGSNVVGNAVAGAPCQATVNILNPLNAVGHMSGFDLFNDQSFGSFHPGGGQFAMADGKVVFVNENIDMNIYKGLATREGGEVARLP